MLDFLIAVLQRSLGLILDFLPYLAAGVLLAEILKYTSWTDFVQKAITDSPVLSVLIAAVLGIASPLCTFGTVPIILTLYKRGTPIAPLVTFLGASSLLNPQLILLTWGGFGVVFATARLGSVFVYSLLLGSVFAIIEKIIASSDAGKVNKNLVEEVSECDGREESSCSSDRKRDIHNFSIKEYLLGAWSNLRFVGRYLIIGVLISVFLEAIVPITLLFEKATMEWLNILFASFLSIPVYICGGGVIPLVKVLMDNGMSNGAAMAFLIVGPATRVTALAALGSFLSKRMIFFYVSFLIAFSFLLGLVMNRLSI